MRSNQAVRILQGRVERLADTLHEVEHSEEKYVGHAELVAGDEGLAPTSLSSQASLSRAVASAHRPPVECSAPALEHLQPFAEAEAVERRLAMLRSMRRVHMRVRPVGRRIADSEGECPSDLVEVFRQIAVTRPTQCRRRVPAPASAPRG